MNQPAETSWALPLLLQAESAARGLSRQGLLQRLMRSQYFSPRMASYFAGLVRAVESAEDHAIAVAAPILAEGDVLGCVMFLSHPGSPAATDLEFKLAQTVAGFLGRQMEG